MSLAIKQVSSRDGQAESRAYQKFFPASARLALETDEGYGYDREEYQLSLQWGAGTRTLNQYLHEANDGISLIQIVSQALAETDTALEEVRKRSNPKHPDYTFEPQEIAFWLKQIDTISQETRFNKMPLLNGELDHTSFTVGEGADHLIRVSLSSSSPGALGLGRDIGQVVRQWQALDGDLSGGLSSENKQNILEMAQRSVADIRATLTPLHHRFEEAIAHLNHLTESTTQAKGRIQDSQVAAEFSALTRDRLSVQPKLSIQAQANQQAQIAMRLLE
ncbi:MAG: hypothetical protein HQL72_00140 [Magnetococcales bacterium]|nr:hypothetical protein [Magnetococcales bacterium]